MEGAGEGGGGFGVDLGGGFGVEGGDYGGAGEGVLVESSW